MSTSSNAVRLDAEAARAAVVDGQKNLADAQARYAAIGGTAGARFDLLRDGLVAASVLVTLSLNGRVIRITQSGAWTYLSDADKDTGSWTARVVNRSDASRYIDLDVTDDVVISADLTATSIGSITPIDVQCPAYDTVSVGAPTSSDSRVINWVDPNIAWAQQPWPSAPGHAMLMQVSDTWNASRAVQDLPEPGIIGAGSDYTFSRVTDPSNGAKKAILHRNRNDFPRWGQSHRSSFSGQGGGNMLEGVDYWIAFAMRIDSSWTTGSNTMGVLDVHHNNWDAGPYGRPTNFPWAPFSINAYSDRSYTVQVHGCYQPGGTQANITSTTLHSSGVVTAGDWHKLAIRVRLATSWAQIPRVSVYRKINSGSIVELANRSDVPISYYDVPANNHYLKAGQYQWDATANDRTTYTKGVMMLRDAAGSPTLDQTSIIALLDSL